MPFLGKQPTETTITISSPVDINSGTVDGAVIGGSSAAAGTFTALVANSLTYPTSDGTNGQALVTNGSGTLSFATITGGLSDVVADTTPQLGGNLDFNGNIATSFESTGIDDNATSTAITIDSSENVGIGNTGNAKLEVFGPLASPSLGTYANSAAIISTTAGGYGMSFSVDGTGTGYIQAQNFTSSVAYNLSLNPAGGNVGIGTTIPSTFSNASELVVDTGTGGGITVVSGSATGGYGALYFADGTTGNEQYRGFFQYNHGSTDEMLIGTAGTTRLKIDSGGDISVTANGGGTSDSGDIVVNARAKFGYDGTRSAAVVSDNGNNKSIVFDTNGSERVRIDTTGEVVISGNGGSTTNSLDLSYNGSSGVANIKADSNGGNTSLTFGTSASGTVSTKLTIASDGSSTFTSGINATSINTTATNVFAIAAGQPFYWKDTNATNGTSCNVYSYWYAQSTTLGYIGYGSNSDSNLYLTNASVGSLYLGASSANGFLANGNVMWHAGNDGSGSGLDADTLDGYNSAQSGANVVLRTDGNGYLVHNNWIKVGNGTGLYLPNGAYFYNDATYGWYSRSSNSGSSSIRLQNVNGTAIGWYYATTSYIQAFLNSTGGYAFQVDNSGNATATGNVTAYSDIRLKENIQPLENSLDKVMRLRGVSYTRKDTGSQEIGVIAQEVEEVIPEFVHISDGVAEDENALTDVRSVDYGRMVSVLIEAIKEQQAQIEELKEAVKCQ